MSSSFAVAYAVLTVALAGRDPDRGWALLVASAAVNTANNSAALSCLTGVALGSYAVESSRLTSAIRRDRFLTAAALAAGAGALLAWPTAHGRMSNPLGHPWWGLVYLVTPLILVAVGGLKRSASGSRACLIGAVVLAACATVTLAVFILLGTSDGRHSGLSAHEDLGLVYSLGAVKINLLRTQAGIPVALLVVFAAGLMISGTMTWGAVPILGVNLVLMARLASTGSALAAAVGVAIVIAVSLRRPSPGKSRRGWALILGVVLVAAAGSWIGTSGYAVLMRVRLAQKMSDYDAFGAQGVDRVEAWRAGVEAMLEEPFGQGWRVDLDNLTVQNAHNDFLVYGVSYGVVGALFLPCVLLSLARRGIKSHSAPGTILAGGVAALVCGAWFDHHVANRFYWSIVWGLLTLLSAATHSPTRNVRSANLRTREQCDLSVRL